MFYVSQVAEFLALYGPYHAHGVLPHGGGSLDQPATFLDAAAVIGGEIAAIQAERMKGDG